jgi:glycolate dehydrogenase FAD-binding subunit
MRASGLEDVQVTTDDAELWARQRAGQRSADGALVRVAARPSGLASVLRAADAGGGTVVGRAGLGQTFIDLDPGGLGTLLQHLPHEATPVLLDCPEELRRSFDPWGGPPEGPALELMRRVKQRFDPARACNPGVFVGAI